MESKAREVEARGIEWGRRGLADAGLGGSSARAQRDASTRKKKGGGKLDEASRVDKNGSRGTRFAATADAWRRRRVAGRGMGAYSGETGEEQWSFNEF